MTGADELLTLAEAAQVLGVHYMTAYRYVRTGRLRAAKRKGTWVVDVDDLERFRVGEPSPGSAIAEASTGVAGESAAVGSPAGNDAARRYASRLEDRLVRGDDGGAWAVMEEALGSSMTPEEVYTSVVGPAMASIGERWARHELAIDDEHLASTIVQRLVGRLGPRFARRGRHRGTIVLGAPSGDAHSIPVMLMADLLRGRGFDVIDLGADTPPTAFARAASNVDRLVAVGVCGTRPHNDDAVAEAVAAIAVATGAEVVLGGHGINEHTGEVVAERLGSAAERVHRTASTDEAIACFEGATTPV